MKNKFYFLINCLLFCFIFLIGFSPQNNTYLINTVYAAKDVDGTGSTTNTGSSGNAPSAIDNITTNSMKDVLDSSTVISESPGKLSENIVASVEMFSKNVSALGSAMSGFAIALSVVVIAQIGFKVMNSGQSDIIKLMKEKKDISNAITCVIFILIVPTLVKSVLDFKTPTFLLSSIDSSVSNTSYLRDIISSPKSGLVSYMKENIPKKESSSSSTNTDNSSSTETTTSSGTKPMLEEYETEENKDRGFFSGLAKKAHDIVLDLITSITYGPVLLVTSFFGCIGFYPVSLDSAMYTGELVSTLNEYFKSPDLNNVINLTNKSILAPTAAGLNTFTQVLNVLYFVVKRFCILCLEVICYYFGIMHLMNKETDDVGKFLGRLSQGVIGMLIFPYFLEFLLDIDGVVSMSICRLTGEVVPGFSILSTVPTFKTASTSFPLLVLSFAFAYTITLLAKAFFVRRIEISLYYIISPVFFLKHMTKSTDGSVKILIERMVSSVFLTTVYSPFFAILTIMMNINTEENDLVYFVLILSILWFGKDVIQNIISSFAGGSLAAGHAQTRLGEGLDKFKSKTFDKGYAGAKVVGGVTKLAATRAAIKGYSSMKNSKAMEKFSKYSNKAKNVVSNKYNNSKLGGSKLGQGAKNLGKTVGKGTGATFRYGSNLAKGAFWEKYEESAAKYDKYTPVGAATRAAEGSAKFVENAQTNDEAKRRAEFKASVYSKYKNDPNKAKKLMDDYDKMMAANSSSHSFFDNNEQFIKEFEAHKHSGLASKATKEAIENNEKLFATTAALEVEKQDLIAKGDYEEAIKKEGQIKANRELFTSNTTKIRRAVNEEVRQSQRIESYESLKSATHKTARFIPNDITSPLNIKDTQTVRKELNNLLLKTEDQAIKEKINTVLQSGSINTDSVQNLVADLSSTNAIDKDSLNKFSNACFDINPNNAKAYANTMGVIAASKTKQVVTNIQNSYVPPDQKQLTATLNKLQPSDAKNAGELTKRINDITSSVNPPSANELSGFVGGLVKDNIIKQEDAVTVLGATFGCTTKEAQQVLSFEKAKTVHASTKVSSSEFTTRSKTVNVSKEARKQVENFVSTSNGDITPEKIITFTQKLEKDKLITKQQGQQLIAQTVNIDTSEVDALVDYHKDVSFNKDVSDIKNSNTVDVVKQIKFNVEHQELLTNAEQVASRKYASKTPAVVASSATSFKGKDMAITQFEELRKHAVNTNNAQAKARVEAAQKAIVNAKDASEAETIVKTFYVNESKTTNGIEKDTLVVSAKTTLGFDERQATRHMKGFVAPNVQKSEKVDATYKVSVQNFDASEPDAILNYLDLTTGKNESSYNQAAVTFVETINKDSVKGDLGEDLNHISQIKQGNGSTIKIKDVEQCIKMHEPTIDKLKTEQLKAINTGSRKTREIAANIDIPGTGNYATVDDNVVYDGHTKRLQYDTDSIGENGSIKPDIFEPYYKKTK